MTSPRQQRPAGAVLAGGHSRRMGGAAKPLLTLEGMPLIQHVIDRVRPQVSSLVLSVVRKEPGLNRFGLDQVEDPKPGCGPLGGLLAALEHMPATDDWLLLAPCDAPFLPHDLGERLLREANSTAMPACLVKTGDELQPTFSVWHCSLLAGLQQAVLNDGLGGFKQFLERTEFAALNWEQGGAMPFFNVNTPSDLARAQHLFDQEHKPGLGKEKVPASPRSLG